MYAQKTTELLRRIRRYKAIGHSILVVNYSGDTRYGTNKIITHDTDSSDAICVKRLEEVGPQVTSGSYQVLIIDEGQFYSDLYEKVRDWADTLPIHIIVTGLDGDSDRNPFGDILKLVPLAEEVERLSALCSVCKDGTLAHFSKALIHKAEQVIIGGANLYVPVCRKHYLN
jgi:thymidine kinase